MFNIAVLGYGNVGRPLVGLLLQAGLPIVSVGVKDVFKSRPHSVNITSDILSLVTSTDVDIVVDALPYNSKTYEAIALALTSKKPVVTCSKALMAFQGLDVCRLAQENNVKVHLGALSASIGPVPPHLANLTSDTFAEVSKVEPLFRFRGADGEETAKSLFKSVINLIELTDD
jgi:homoserine dehydrogenase